MAGETELIMSTVESMVTGLTTTGDEVHRGRTNPLAEGATNALSLYQGPDDKVADEWPTSRRALTLYIDAHTQSPTEQVDTRLNQIRDEVDAAMTAVRSLGLSFVIDVEPGGPEEPELSGDGEQVTAVLRMPWLIKYRR